MLERLASARRTLAPLERGFASGFILGLACRAAVMTGAEGGGALAEASDMPILRYFGWRREAPLFYAIILIGAVETAVTHLVVSHFSSLAAWLLTGLSLFALLLVLTARHLLRTRPVELAADALHVPVGLRGSVRIPIEQLALTSPAIAPERNDRCLETLSLFGCNFQLTVAPPLIVRRGPGERLVLRVRMSLDDVAEFSAEFLRRKAWLLAK